MKYLPLTPEQLIASRTEARRVVSGFALFSCGFGLLAWHSQIEASVPMVPGFLLAMAGAALVARQNRAVLRRVRPPGQSRFQAWSFDSHVGQQWWRRDVRRRAFSMLRADEPGRSTGQE